MGGANPKPGDIIGSYIVRSQLGEGGMGLVFLAEHAKLQRKVALKLLRPELVRDPVAAKRFFAEAKAVNAIAHENIVEVTDFVDEGEHQYFVMELLKGAVLSDVVQQGPLPVPRAVHIGGQIAVGLSAAHAAGIVHRDLKPQNVFLITRGRDRDFVKLLDFGIAKMHGASEEESVQTQAGTVLGTPAYLAPEQLSRPPGDHRVDIYAFGILLFEMTLGRRPFKGNMAELMRQHLFEAPPRPSVLAPGYPAALEALVLRCLGKTPDDRPESMQRVADLLEGIAEDVGPFRADSSEQSGLWAFPATGGWQLAPLELASDDAALIEEGAMELRAPAPVPLPQEPTRAFELGEVVGELKPEPEPEPEPEHGPLAEEFGGGTPCTTESASPPEPHPRALPKRAIAAGVISALTLGAIALFALGGGEPAPRATAVAGGEGQAPRPPSALPPEPPPPPPSAQTPGAAVAHAMVEVTIESEPPGAAVSVTPASAGKGAKAEELGKTPLIAKLPAGGVLRLVLQRAGFEPYATELTPREGARVAATLAPKAPKAPKAPAQRPAAASAKKHPSLQDGALKDPFKKRK